MSTELAIPGQQLGDGFEGVSIRPEDIELVQRMSSTPGATPGTYRGKTSGKTWTTLRAVILEARFSRSLFPPRGQGDNRPICYSLDCVRPAERAQNPQARTCAQCKHSSWAAYRETHVAPPCKERVSLNIVDANSGFPYRLQLPASSVGLIKAALGNVMKFAISASKESGAKLSLYDFVVRLGISEKRPASGGIVYGATVEEITPVPEAGMYRPYYESLVLSRKLAKEDDAIDTAIEGAPEPSEPVPY